MRNLLKVASALGLLFMLGCVSAEVTPNKKMTFMKAWETSSELRVPESVMYDEFYQTVYISNIDGKPTEKNGKGFISEINLDGTIKTLKWVTGLNAPKGMGIVGRILYVTDVDQVHAININSGVITQTWDVEGAKFLNDIAVSSDDDIYITDMMTKSIHVIQDGVMQKFVSLEYSRPNGLFMMGRDLLVGTAEGVVKIDLQTKAVSMKISHTGGIDGLKQVSKNRFLVSDWKGKIQVIEKDREPMVLSDTSSQKINAADLEYIPGKNLVLVPTFFKNRIVAYQFK